MQSSPIFKFNKLVSISDWRTVNDVVMGGKSSSEIYLNEQGKGVFKGYVSLENNGGFSSLRYQFNKMNTKPYSKIIVRIRGDEKKYQFRIKAKVTDKHSYTTVFNTSKDWEVIEISLSDMYPVFRGRKLDMPNYDGESIEEIAFLIGNKKAESFKLEIDTIVLS